MSLSALLRELPDRADLREQADNGLSPQFLTIEGVRRTRGRELTPAEAVAHAERGRPAYVLTFGKCVQVSPGLLAVVLNDEDLQPEANCSGPDILMYGRHRHGEADTRLVVVSVVAWID
ncbi:hypothetical protein NUM3379_34820 [Kineococcus sp. NUM-3379]